MYVRKSLLSSIAAIAALLAFAGPAAAAPFTVDDLSDASDPVLDGVCDATGSDTCTLRAALEEANATSATDAITVSVPGTITLTGGVLTGTEEMTLNGHSAVTTIDGNEIGRVFSFGGPSVTLNDLRVQNGATSGSNGAGIFSTATELILNRVTVTDNTVAANLGEQGGGIATGAGSILEINDSTISDNQLTGANGDGGGIGAGGPVTITNSTISGNSSTLDAAGRGGGIFGTTNVSTITNSTISGNHAGGGGGGGMNAPFAAPSIIGSTIAGNTTTGVGGGLRFGGGGGASKNSIYAGNTDAFGGPNCNTGNAFSPAESNIDTGTSCNFGTSDGNQENVATGALGLGALASNGGFTQTRLPSPTSVAVNTAGDCAGLTTDQRGFTRPQGTSCDIGAVELREFNLAVARTGTGSGSVSGTGIVCPSDCSETVLEGSDPVALTPSAASGSTFSGWSGACTGTGACSVTMDAAKSVTADFTADPVVTPKPAPTPTPSPGKKCKKGQKLKKGKCVKKKKRKKK